MNKRQTIKRKNARDRKYKKKIAGINIKSLRKEFCRPQTKKEEIRRMLV
jgi:hypothetical protein